MIVYHLDKENHSAKFKNNNADIHLTCIKHLKNNGLEYKMSVYGTSLYSNASKKLIMTTNIIATQDNIYACDTDSEKYIHHSRFIGLEEEETIALDISYAFAMIRKLVKD